MKEEKKDSRNIKKNLRKLYPSPVMLKRKCLFLEEKSFFAQYKKLLAQNSKTSDLEYELEKTLEKLLDNMYFEIGNLDEAVYKEAVYIRKKVRKRNFNVSEEQLKKYFTKETQELFFRCKELSLEIIDCHKTQSDIFESIKESEEENLRHLLINNFNFRNGVYHSGDATFLEQLDKFVLKNLNDKNKKLKVCRALQNYKNRMMFKPTPFSTFVSTEILCIDEQLEYSSLNKTSSQFSKVMLNEQIFFQLSHNLLNNFSLIDSFYVKLNPTIIKLRDQYLYFTLESTETGIEYYYYREKIRTISQNEKLNLLIGKLQSKNNLLIELAKELAMLDNKNFSNISDTINYILYLSEIGFLHRNFNISQFDYNGLEKMGNVSLKANENSLDKLSSKVMELTTVLNRINIEKSNFDIGSIKNKLIRLAKEILRESGDDEPNVEGLDYKNIIYENNIVPVLGRTKIPNVTFLESLYGIEKIFRILDNSIISKILIRNIFLAKFKQSDSVTLLDLYMEYMKVVKLNESHIYLKDSKDYATIETLRKDILEYLKLSLKKDKINFSLEKIDSYIKRMPKIFNQKVNYGVYFQQSQSGELIVNKFAPGSLRHFSRYIEYLDVEEKVKFTKISKEYIDTLEKTQNKKFADIGTTLGLNINKHTELANYTIGYPHAYTNSNIDISQLRVFYDSDIENIKLIDEKNNIIDISPMGFQFHRTAPDLYCFLSLLSSSQGIELNIWDSFSGYFGFDETKFFPQITVENTFIIERKTWKFDSMEYKLSNPRHLNELERYLRYIDFFKKLNIPSEKFFVRAVEDINVKETPSTEVMNEWLQKITNNKLRKPQLYDLASYNDFKNLDSIIFNCSGIITAQELYPNTHPAEEFLIEINEL
ncbi:hypothetical protein Q7W37_00785 [Streptococcus suis]|nr:hypothetical protein [Streptococcus suis]